VADAANGTASFCSIGDNLNAKVVEALAKAVEPSYTDARVRVEGAPMGLEYPESGNAKSLYRNHLFAYSGIAQTDDPASLKFSLNCFEPRMNSGLEITALSYQELPEGKELFKLVAKRGTQRSTKQGREIAKTYQVLLPGTAFIGVIR